MISFYDVWPRRCLTTSSVDVKFGTFSGANEALIKKFRQPPRVVSRDGPDLLDSVPETRTSITFVMPSPDEAESVVAAMESQKERPDRRQRKSLSALPRLLRLALRDLSSAAAETRSRWKY